VPQWSHEFGKPEPVVTPNGGGVDAETDCCFVCRLFRDAAITVPQFYGASGDADCVGYLAHGGGVLVDEACEWCVR